MIIKSIRWRLQLWLAFLLVCTLSGFGIATYEAHRLKQYQQVDEQLDRHFDTLAGLARGPGPLFSGGRREPPPDMRGGPPGRFDDFTRNGPREPGGPGFRPGFSFDRIRQVLAENGIYFAVWNQDGSRLDGSTNAPSDLPQPAKAHAADSGPHFRTRSVYREGYDFNREGRCVLIGRSMAPELASMRGFAFVLAVAGLAVLALGLGGGWLIVTRAIRPVEHISATARRIAEGNLAERINVTDTDGELGQLAGTLNSTFARLDASFAQQKQFTADASHELRTPIAVIISEAQTTLARERTAREYRETVETCLDTAQQMRRLTDSLLELARLDASQPSAEREPLDLAELTRQRVEFIRPLAEQRGLRIHCKLSAAPTSGNPDHLGLVINNLLSNAIHYNAPNGEITVSTGVDGNQALLTVADTGHGIAAEDLPLIFDRFYRADKSRSRAEGRCGLGLAICKAVVEAHGGNIQVTSAPGCGTTFTVRLPA